MLCVVFLIISIFLINNKEKWHCFKHKTDLMVREKSRVPFARKSWTILTPVTTPLPLNPYLHVSLHDNTHIVILSQLQFIDNPTVNNSSRRSLALDNTGILVFNPTTARK
jgi:hypothetical protein